MDEEQAVMDEFEKKLRAYMNPELEESERRKGKPYKESGLDYKRMNARMRMERVSAGYESLDTFLQVMKGVTGYTVSRNTAYSFEGGVINKRTGDKVGKKPDLSYLVAFCLTLCADQRKGRYWGDLLIDILIDSMPEGFEKAERHAHMFKDLRRGGWPEFLKTLEHASEPQQATPAPPQGAVAIDEPQGKE